MELRTSPLVAVPEHFRWTTAPAVVLSSAASAAADLSVAALGPVARLLVSVSASQIGSARIRREVPCMVRALDSYSEEAASSIPQLGLEPHDLEQPLHLPSVVG